MQLKNVILIIAHLIHQDYVNKKLDFTKIGLLNLICLLSLGHFVEHELRSLIRWLSRPLNQPAYIDTVNINGRILLSTSLCHFYSRLVFAECLHNHTRKICDNYMELFQLL